MCDDFHSALLATVISEWLILGAAAASLATVYSAYRKLPSRSEEPAAPLCLGARVCAILVSLWMITRLILLHMSIAAEYKFIPQQILIFSSLVGSFASVGILLLQIALLGTHFCLKEGSPSPPFNRLPGSCRVLACFVALNLSLSVAQAVFREVRAYRPDMTDAATFALVSKVISWIIESVYAITAVACYALLCKWGSPKHYPLKWLDFIVFLSLVRHLFGLLSLFVNVIRQEDCFSFILFMVPVGCKWAAIFSLGLMITIIAEISGLPSDDPNTDQAQRPLLGDNPGPAYGNSGGA